MIAAPIFTDRGVSTEVPIVLAEMRERSGAAQRVGDATRALFFAGQPLADRSPIGREDTLRAASAASVKAFHDRWYRPENTVIVVAGDAQPAQLEALVKKWFSDWQASGKPAKAPSFGDPVPPKGADKAELGPVGE